MTYEEKYDKLNRLVGKIDGIFRHHIAINKPLSTYEMDKLTTLMEQAVDKTEQATVTDSYEPFDSIFDKPIDQIDEIINSIKRGKTP